MRLETIERFLCCDNGLDSEDKCCWNVGVGTLTKHNFLERWNKMDSFELEIPVLLCFFNRISTLELVLDAIKKAAPKRIYLVSDGARDDVKGETDRVSEVRNYVESRIDWDCEVFKNYSDKNLGCGKRMPTGIDWAFEQEDKLIIIEDDCVPSEDFFKYCQEMLFQYENNPRIMIVSGNNPIEYADDFNGYSYGFSKFPQIWGWATWKRVWDKYDNEIKSWTENKNLKVWKEIYNTKTRWKLSAEFDLLRDGLYDAWDYQVTYLLGVEDGYATIPKANLVSNIGFCSESTHTSNMPKWMSQKVENIFEFPLKHPQKIKRSEKFEREYMKKSYASGYICKIKHMLGIDINVPIVDVLRKKRKTN